MSGPLRTKHPFLGGCGRVKIVNTFVLNIAHSWPPWDKLSSVLWDESHRTQESTARIIWFLSYFSPTAGAAPMRGKVVAIEQIEHQLFLPLPNCWVTILLLSLSLPLVCSSEKKATSVALEAKGKATSLPSPFLPIATFYLPSGNLSANRKQFASMDFFAPKESGNCFCNSLIAP